MKKIVESRCEVCGDLLESDISSGCTTCLKREMLGLKKIETQSTVPSGISRGSFVKKFALWTLSGFVVWFFIVQMTKEPVRHGGFRDEKTAPVLTEHERIIKAILDSPVDPLQPEGELSKIFRYFSEYTVLRRDHEVNKIKGKVVVWKMSVYDISESDGVYTITTNGCKRAQKRIDCVDTSIKLLPRSQKDVDRLLDLKMNDSIEFKGQISDVSFRTIIVNPAVLID